MRTLTEKEAEDFLEKQGFDVVKRALAKSKQDLNKITEKIKFPWVMKASSKSINHKMKMGAVKLNIKNLKEAQENFDKLSRIEGFEQAMIQEMANGKELILGIKNTPEFGHVIMLGAGGINVEKEKDVSFRALPVTEKDEKEMLQDLKIYPKVKNNINQELILKNIKKLTEIIEENPTLNELDINPLFVNEKQAVIADARIVFN